MSYRGRGFNARGAAIRMKTRYITVTGTAVTPKGEEMDYQTVLVRMGDNTPSGHIRLTAPLSVREAETVLRAVIEEGATPLTIDGQPAYDPDELKRAIEALQMAGRAVSRASLHEFHMEGESLTPQQIIERAGEEYTDVPV